MSETAPRARPGRRSRPYPITLHDLEVMVVACRSPDPASATTELGVSKPALIRRLRKLEERVGLDLFSGLPGTIDLTPAGVRMLPLATAAYERLTALDAFIAAEPQTHARPRSR